MASTSVEPRLIGYARVGLDEDCLEVQVEQLRQFGCVTIYQEIITTDRVERTRMLGALNAGDVLIVTRMARIARSTFDLLDLAKQIRAKGAGLKSLSEPLVHMSPSEGANLVAVLETLADIERDVARTRSTDTRDISRTRRGNFGRPSALTEEQKIEVVERLAKGETIRALASKYKVGKSTINRLKTR